MVASNGRSSTGAGGPRVVAVAGVVREGSRSKAQALTCGGAGTYHGVLRYRRSPWKMIAAGAWLLPAMS